MTEFRPLTTSPDGAEAQRRREPACKLASQPDGRQAGRLEVSSLTMGLQKSFPIKFYKFPVALFGQPFFGYSDIFLLFLAIHKKRNRD